MYIDPNIRHKIRYLCEYDEKMVDTIIDTLIEYEEDCRNNWIDIMEDLYHNRKYYGNKLAKISKNALKLSKKLENDLNIFVFPHIRRVACRGWTVSGGTWSWAMRSLFSGDVGSCDKAKDILRVDKIKIIESPVSWAGEVSV